MTEQITPEELISLRRTYLFSGLEDEEFTTISAHVAAINLDASQVLFRHGDDAQAFYWVEEGMIRLSRMSPQGDEKVIDLIGSGRYFAEAAIFMGKRYPVDAIAQIPTRLIAIDANSYRTWLGQDVERCFRLIGSISAKMHKLVNDIDHLTLMKGTDRLMQYLLDHSEPDEHNQTVAELVAPKQVIASRIGVKPETMSRLLHKLVEMGHIKVDGQKILILSE